MLPVFRAAALLVLLVSTGSRSQERSFFFSPLISYDSFHTIGFDSGPGFGAGVSYQLNPDLVLSAAVAYSQRSVRFDVIGGEQALGARLLVYECSLEILALGHPGAGELAVTLGGGGVATALDSRVVSVGALGSVIVPERTGAQGFVKTGLSAGIPLSPGVNLVLLPALRFFAPFSSFSADVSLEGGLRVGIF